MLVLAVALVAGGCSGDDDDAASTTVAPSTTVSSSTTTTTDRAVSLEESLRLTDACPGIGALTGEAELTWIADDRIWAASPDGGEPHCVAEFTGFPALRWGGDADRLAAGERSVLLVSGPAPVVPEDHRVIGWSRPTGRALIARGPDGALTKLSPAGEPRFDLPLPLTTGDVQYHPAGTAIALVSIQPDSVTPPDLLFASNQGEDVRWLVQNESAAAITDVEFSADGALLFTADHGGHWHLHRLVLGTEDLEILLEGPAPLHGLTASPWADGDFAVGRPGGCGDGEGLWVRRGEEVVDLAGTAIASGTPVGWFPNGDLAVIVHPDGCDLPPGDLYVLTDGGPRLVAEDVGAAAVRAPLPPPAV